jgi:E3 ubiquitin-protein ligase TRIP12
VSTELQRSDLGLWNDSDSYKHEQVMADAIKSPSIPASDEQTQLIYIHQTSGASSVTLDDLRSGNNNGSENTVLNNNQINMLIEQQHDAGTQTHIIENSQLATPRQGSTSANENIRYVNAPHGLFPMPLSKTAKTSQISRLKFKFKFLGKFMAKAVMDSRMVSL